ncbi:DUF4275 family protein [Alkalihalobacillus deserti]|uniref:DUF4275 family protein n=1 Tax=Alkalihalobacillus deserti TaxID=2879466 RepID=UPI00223DCE0C|nr:DUF4275 family protein [Alkalihalobacillus deserti]
MDLIKLFDDKGIIVTQLNNNSEELRIKLWHVFSNKKLNCIENEEAIDAFNKQKKTVCYVFLPTKQ